MATPAQPVAQTATGFLARWSRPLAVAAAIVFFVSLAFPMIAGLSKNTASFPLWWGRLDVGLAFVLAIMALVIIAVAQGKVNRPAEEASYRLYRILTHGILALLVAFFVFGDRIAWINCLTGFAWRAWLLLYSLPAWFSAVRITGTSYPEGRNARKVAADRRLRAGIASFTNFAVLVALLLCFPLVLRWTGALSVAEINPQHPQHTGAFLKFCFVLTAFLWMCFAIALAGSRRSGRITWQELIGAQWSRWQTIVGDLGIALATLVAMAVIGNLSNAVLGAFQHDSAALHSMVAQNTAEALAFLTLALTAGFVEEFVFRGYVQRQCQALCGSALVASILQLIIFTQGHLYQGLIRLVPVMLIGVVLTIVALWRKSLIPGMIAHGLGDGLVAFSFFLKHL